MDGRMKEMRCGRSSLDSADFKNSPNFLHQSVSIHERGLGCAERRKRGETRETIEIAILRRGGKGTSIEKSALERCGAGVFPGSRGTFRCIG